MAELEADFLPRLAQQVTFDFTTFITASIREIITTLFMAMGLVFLVTYLFMQNFRATLISTITIPVALLATFAVLLAAGFTLNMLTLFGLILAIGIVVDDAITVVENMSRNINDKGLEPKEAARQTMGEITGAIIATTLVVLAVFIPTALLGGMTGVL